MTKPRRKLHLALFALAGIFLLLIVYYAVEVFQAREHTKNKVRPLLQSPAMALKLGDLTKRQLDILLAVEDPAFSQHNGMDLSTPGAGLTTITQSLVKILYFKKFQPGLAKIRQTLIAIFALDPLVSKKEQLTLYINLVGLGQGARGFAAAAQKYFSKPFKALNEDEYISLVAMIVAPRTFNLKRHPERNAERVARIKKLISGRYQPKGLYDLYYGKLDKDAQKEVAPFSYFESYYKDQ